MKSKKRKNERGEIEKTNQILKFRSFVCLSSTGFHLFLCRFSFIFFSFFLLCLSAVISFEKILSLIIFQLFFYKFLEKCIKMSKKKSVEKVDKIDQQFQDDPWLKPFEGEIRRRWEKFDMRFTIWPWTWITSHFISITNKFPIKTDSLLIKKMINNHSLMMINSNMEEEE